MKHENISLKENDNKQIEEKKTHERIKMNWT